MKKNITIIVLAVLSIVSLFSLSSMSSRASYWMNRCDAAEALIDEMAEYDEDLFLDVFMEGDCYNLWYQLGGNN